MLGHAKSTTDFYFVYPRMISPAHIDFLGLGQHGISVIVATVGLDDGLMQIAHDWKVTIKTDVIPKDVMENIVKVRSCYITMS